DRHVALRVPGFLGRGRDRIKPDVGEEDDGGGLEDAAVAEGAEVTVIGRDQRVQVGRVDVTDAENNEQHYHRHLDGDDDRVESGRLFDADVADGGDCGHD